MRARCSSPSDKNYKYYGARGVTVCERWSSFAVFVADVGPRPAGMSLDRIDPNGNYEPGNVRWATPLEQTRNRRNTKRLEAFGESLTASEWSERTGVSRFTIASRIRKGWSAERAVSTPPLKHPLTINGETRPATAWCKQLGVPLGTFYGRLARGWSEARSLGIGE